MPTAREVPHTSVVSPAHKPLFLQGVKNKAIDAGSWCRPAGTFEFDFPRIFLPRVLPPPGPGQPPWSRGMNHFPCMLLPADSDRTVHFENDRSRQRRAEVAKTDFRLLSTRHFCKNRRARIAVVSGLGWAEFLHPKGVWTIGIKGFRRPHIAFADHTCNASERELQLAWIGCGRKEQPTLHRHRPIRFRAYQQFLHRSVWRPVLQTQAQKLQQQLGVLRGPRKSQRTMKLSGKLSDAQNFPRGIKRILKSGLQITL